MMDYLDILKDWERRVADPCIFEHLDELLPAYGFRRVCSGSVRDHWASPLKIDLSMPKTRNAEKTVVYAEEMRLREQGDWDNPVGVNDALMRELGVADVYELYSTISDRYSLDMPRRSSADAKAAGGRKLRQKMILEKLQDYFMWNLEHNKAVKAGKVRAYLKTRRGFTKESIQTLGFGFVPDWNQVIGHVVTRGGFSKEEFDSVCMVMGEDGKTPVGRTHTLSIPYRCAGELKGFIFRRVDSDEAPKYIANTGLDRKSAFFNMPAGQISAVAVVEGEMDALSATAAGIPGIVAIGGSAISGERRKQVEEAFRHGVGRIILCPDLDTKTTADGEVVPNYEKRYSAILRSIHTIKDINIDFDAICVAEFPEPSDPDEYIRSHGKDAFIALLRAARPWWEFLHSAHK